MKLKFQRYYGDIAWPAPRKTDHAGLLLLYIPFHTKNLGSGHVLRSSHTYQAASMSETAIYTKLVGDFLPYSLLLIR